MTRKRRNIADADVDRWIIQGFGQGEGQGYMPWAKVRDVPSIGRSSRVGCFRFPRETPHHLYSDVELGHFLLADFRADVCEIREQVALLPREETIEIAEKLGIRHPRYPYTPTFVVLTSDLLVFALSKGVLCPFVLSVKRRSSLLPGAKDLCRTIQKLTLERAYWARRGVRWFLVTEDDYNEVVVKNLGILRPSRQAWISADRLSAASDLAEQLTHPSAAHKTLREHLSKTAGGIDTAYQNFGLAIWKRWLPLDLRQALRWNAPVPLLSEAPPHAR